MIIEELQTLQSAQLIRAEIEPTIEANVLLALVNGVSLDSLIQAKCLSVDQQESVIRRYVKTMLCVRSR